MSILVLILIIGFSVLIFTALVLRFVLLFNYKLEKVPRLNEVEINKDFILLRDGETIDSYSFFSQKSDVLFIFFHGFGAHLHQFDWLKRYCQKHHFSLILPSRRHSGKNVDHVGTKYNLGIEANDYFDISQKARQMFPKHKIIVLGHSLGAALLAEFASWKKTQKLQLQFVIINTLTNFRALNPFNFIENSWKGIGLFFYGFFFKRRQILQLQPWTSLLLLHCCNNCNNQYLKKITDLVKKYEFQPKILRKKLVPYKLCVRKLPFYYFTNFLTIFYNTFRNLSKNKVDQIWIVQGKEDDYSNSKLVRKNQVRLDKKDNCNFLYIDDFGHGFLYEDTSDEDNWWIFDIIVDAVVANKTSFSELTEK